MGILKNLFFFAALLIISCNSHSTRRVILDDEIAEGEISKDTVYNGLIKFYNIKTNVLVTIANYRNGILEGIRTEFYPNGKKKAEINYDNGKVNGFSKFYNSDGKLLEQQYNYYDLRVGPSLQYVDGKPSKFYFYSFENSSLFYIDYDSIYNKKIGDVQKDFFFMKKYQIYLNTSTVINHLKDEYFIYLIDPPKYNTN